MSVQVSKSGRKVMPYLVTLNDGDCRIVFGSCFYKSSYCVDKRCVCIILREVCSKCTLNRDSCSSFLFQLFLLHVRDSCPLLKSLFAGTACAVGGTCKTQNFCILFSHGYATSRGELST